MGERYTTYSDYKESGIPWVGHIPSSWEVKPTYSVFSADVDKNTNGEETNVLSLSYGHIIKRDVEKNFGLLPESFNTYQIVDDGDLILRLTDLQNDKNSLRVGLVKQKGIITSAYLKLQSTQRIEPRYAYRLLHSYDTTKVFYGMGGGLRQSMKFEDFRRLPIILPPLEEQQKITNFLDHETSKIDTLITKQEKLIELLKEKRQAVISHAVTKGLNPDAPMKDSGVEWLGEVPEHWFVVPIKRMCEVKDGTHDTPKYVDKGENSFPLITSKDFEGKNISFENAKYISKEAHREIVKRSNTEVGDVLMSMIGGNIGKALIVKETAEFSIKNVALFKTTRKSALASYILYYLESGLLDIQISLQSRGGAQGFLSLGDLRNLVFFKVPEGELNTIVEHLDLKISKYDRLINIASDKITLLSERKTALISAAVTGKIDVRDWEAE